VENENTEKIYGPTYKNDYWRIKLNQEMYNKFNSPNIITVIKVCRLKVWACCKIGWYKDSNEVTGRQARRREKKRKTLT
jgi:hypothetical protein